MSTPDEVEAVENVDDRNVRLRAAVQQLDETLAVIAAEMLGDPDV